MDHLIGCFVTGAVAGFVVAVPFGAISAIIVEAALSQGARAGLLTALAASLADVVHAALAAAGFAALVASNPNALSAAQGMGGALLLVVGTFQLRSARRSAVGYAIHSGKSRFLGTFVLVMSDPMTVLLFVAALAGNSSINGEDAKWYEWSSFSIGVLVGTMAWRFPAVTALALVRARLSEAFITRLRFAGAFLLVAAGISFVAMATA